MNYKYIIIEDNPAAFKNLKLALDRYPFLIFDGHAESYLQGKRLIVETKPSLIFLDVELGEKKGFDLIQEIRPFFHKLPKIIMTTGHIKYARNAVNDHYHYFLEKPIDPDEVFLALEKFKTEQLKENRTLDLRNSNGHHFFSLDEIYYFEATGNKTKIIKTDLSEEKFTKTLKEIGDQLPPDFLRIHKSFIINTKYIEKVNLTKRLMILNVKSGLMELGDASHELINLTSGKSITIEESLRLKDCRVEIQIGESYLENLRNSLFIFTNY